MKFIWSCYGFDVRGHSDEPVDEIMQIVNDNVEEVRKTMPSLLDGESMRIHGGALLYRLVVELRSKDIRVSIDIDPGHLMQHTCGRIYLPEEWGALEIKGVTVKNIAGDGSARMPMRLCGCGEFVGYSEMSVTHAEDVCNAMGARGAAN